MAERDLSGLWTDILTKLGVDPACLRGRDCPCPVCGGEDRFRYDNKKNRGTWYCRGGCGAGDGYRLIMLLRGVTFLEAAKMAEKLAGVARREPPKRQLTPERARKLLTELWQSGVHDHPRLREYLSSRGLEWREQRAVRFAPECFWKHESQTGKAPAMISQVFNSDTRKPITLHRTYLSRLPCARKKLMPTTATKYGTYIPLFGDPIDGVLGVAEGIETAWSAAQLESFCYPVWATVDEAGMAQFVPPEGVRRLIVFGDADTSFTGQASAFALAKRCANGRSKIEVEVRFPPVAAMDVDWNDYLKGLKDEVPSMA